MRAPGPLGNSRRARTAAQAPRARRPTEAARVHDFNAAGECATSSRLLGANLADREVVAPFGGARLARDGAFQVAPRASRNPSRSASRPGSREPRRRRGVDLGRLHGNRARLRATPEVAQHLAAGLVGAWATRIGSDRRALGAIERDLEPCPGGSARLPPAAARFASRGLRARRLSQRPAASARFPRENAANACFSSSAARAAHGIARRAQPPDPFLASSRRRRCFSSSASRRNFSSCSAWRIAPRRLPRSA